MVRAVWRNERPVTLVISVTKLVITEAKITYNWKHANTILMHWITVSMAKSCSPLGWITARWDTSNCHLYSTLGFRLVMFQLLHSVLTSSTWNLHFFSNSSLKCCHCYPCLGWTFLYVLIFPNIACTLFGNFPISEMLNEQASAFYKINTTGKTGHELIKLGPRWDSTPQLTTVTKYFYIYFNESKTNLQSWTHLKSCNYVKFAFAIWNLHFGGNWAYYMLSF